MRQYPLRVPLSRPLEATVDLLASYNVSSQLNLIEDMIAQGADRQTVLRLLVLASICGGGVKAKSLENLKREVLQVDHPHRRFQAPTYIGLSLRVMDTTCFHSC